MFKTSEQEQTREVGGNVEPGFYKVAFTAVDYKNGAFISKLKIIEPDEGGMIYHRCTFEHTNEQAVTIGRSQLADMLFTMQIPEFKTADDLEEQARGKEFIVETGIDKMPDDAEYVRVLACWSLGGKHRNEARHLEKVELVKTGRKPRIVKGGKKSAPAKQQNTVTEESDIPF